MNRTNKEEKTVCDPDAIRKAMEDAYRVYDEHYPERLAAKKAEDREDLIRVFTSGDIVAVRACMNDHPPTTVVVLERLPKSIGVRRFENPFPCYETEELLFVSADSPAGQAIIASEGKENAIAINLPNGEQADWQIRKLVLTANMLGVLRTITLAVAAA